MKLPAGLSLPSYDEAIEQLGRVSDKKRRGAEALTLGLILLAYLALWARPNVTTLDELNESLARAGQNLAEKQAFANHFNVYLHELDINKTRLSSAHELLPDDPDIPQFLAKLGAMANSLDITIERLEPSREVPRDFYAEISLHVQVRGSFHQVATLIDQIGNQARIVNVTNVTFTDPKAKQQKIQVEGQFDVKIFRFLTDEQIVANQAKGKAP